MGNIQDDIQGVVDSIKAKSDNLPSDPADESLLEAAITSAKNEILVETGFIEYHEHTKERWYGKIAGNNETNAIENNLTPFRVTSGVGDYGTGVCVIGSADVPVDGKTSFDLHRILCSNFQKAELAKIRLAWGTSTEAAAVAAGNYTTIVVNPQVTAKESETNVRFPVVANGTKIWVNFWSVTNSQWVDVFVGVHGY